MFTNRVSLPDPKTVIFSGCNVGSPKGQKLPMRGQQSSREIQITIKKEILRHIGRFWVNIVFQTKDFVVENSLLKVFVKSHLSAEFIGYTSVSSLM